MALDTTGNDAAGLRRLLDGEHAETLAFGDLSVVVKVGS